MTAAIDKLGAAIIYALQLSAEPIKAGELRRSLGCSPSDWSKAVQRLRWQGRLEFDSFTLAPSLRQSPGASPSGNLREKQAAPSQGAETEGAVPVPAPAAGGALPQGGDAAFGVPPADEDRVGGDVAAQLLAECEAFLADHPMPVTTFGRLAAGQTMLLERLRNARIGPQWRTVRRVRGFMSSWCDRVEELRSSSGVPGSFNSETRAAAIAISEEQREREADQRRAIEAARGSRRAGETLDDAVRREASELGERRREARKLSATVHDPIDLSKRIAHHPKARKFEPLPGPLWAELRRLAEERGEQPMELLPTVVEQGIAALRRAA